MPGDVHEHVQDNVQVSLYINIYIIYIIYYLRYRHSISTICSNELRYSACWISSSPLCGNNLPTCHTLCLFYCGVSMRGINMLGRQGLPGDGVGSGHGTGGVVMFWVESISPNYTKTWVFRMCCQASLTIYIHGMKDTVPPNAYVDKTRRNTFNQRDENKKMNIS